MKINKSYELKLCLAAFMLLLPCFAMAGRFVTRFEKGARLAVKGNDIYITNWNLEWPVLLDNDSTVNLADTLSRIAFGKALPSLAETLNSLTPEGAKTLDKMPDGSNYNITYTNAEVKILWYEQGKYITLSATGQRRKQDGTVIFSRRKIFTYDLTAYRELTKTDFFKPSCLKHNENSQMLYELIANCSNVSTSTLITWDKTVASPSIVGNSIFFDLTEATELSEPMQYSTVPISTLSTLFFSKDFRKWLAVKVQQSNEASQKDRSSKELDDLTPEKGITEANTDASVQVYDGGYKKLMADIGNLLKSGDISSFSGRDNKTVVSFIVEKDGSISNITILKPMNASSDREIANALAATTGWKPIKKNGEAIRMKMTIPFSFVTK